MRTLLLIRADRPHLLQQALARADADVALEAADGTVQGAGDLAHVYAAAAGHAPFWLRVLPFEPGPGEAELSAVMRACPCGLLLPGVRRPADIQRLGARLAVAEAEAGLAVGTTRILAGASDTPAGVLALDRLPGASQRLAGLVWDEEALASMLDEWGEADRAACLEHARIRTMMAAAACGVPAFRVTRA